MASFIHSKIIVRTAPLAACLLIHSHADAQSIAYQICDSPGHFDVYIEVDNPGADDGQFLLDVVRDSSGNIIPGGTFPVDATGAEIVPATVSLTEPQRNKTDDPGWVVAGGHMLGASQLPGSAEVGEILWFRALSSLRYWDPELSLWLNRPPNGERVFFGGGTVWDGDSVSGQIEAPIEEAAAVLPGFEAIHTHLDFCIADATGSCDGRLDNTGNPSLGGYMIEFELFSTAVKYEGGTPTGEEKYRPSNSLKIIISNGLTPESCDAAVSALIDPETVVDDSDPQPAAGILIMSGP